MHHHHIPGTLNAHRPHTDPTPALLVFLRVHPTIKRLAIVGGEDSGFGDDDIPSGNVPYSQKRSDPQPFLPRLNIYTPCPRSSSPSSSTTPPTKQSSSKPALHGLGMRRRREKRHDVCSRLSTWGRRGHQNPGPEAKNLLMCLLPSPCSHHTPKTNRILRKQPPVTDADAEDVVLGGKVELRRVGRRRRAAAHGVTSQAAESPPAARLRLWSQGRCMRGLVPGGGALGVQWGACSCAGVTVHLLLTRLYAHLSRLRLDGKTAAIGLVRGVALLEVHSPVRGAELYEIVAAVLPRYPALRTLLLTRPPQHSGQLHDVSALGPAFTALTIAVHAVDAGDPISPCCTFHPHPQYLHTIILVSVHLHRPRLCTPIALAARSPSPSSPHRPLSPAFTLAPPPDAWAWEWDGWGDTGDVLTGVDAPALPLHALQPKALLEVRGRRGRQRVSREDAAHVAAWRWRCAGLECVRDGFRCVVAAGWE
ncbi:hypothetical protein B0H14DRAFT_3507829 [Mycena olivaceomarginata]|nr:hypothetical protein B0H14DRAFT_3507829 [Mycena olivaceomarginata]